MDRPKRIAYVPYTDVNNAYVSRMQEILRRFGSVERFMRPRQAVQEFLAGRLKRYDATFFNWVENDFLAKGTGTVSTVNVVKVLVKTCIARLLSRRMVFVRHNVYPHTLRPGNEAGAMRLIAWYERWFDVVITHSGAHMERGNLYCPHPLYRRAEDPAGDVRDPMPDLPAHYFVMFGRVAPYKRIVEAARAFPAECTLLIIGSVTDQAYGRAVQEVGRPNVLYRPGYIDEASAQRLIRRSQGIVLAHAGENTVVSGSFFYAMSLPVPVLAVETPFLRWIAPKVGDDLLALAPDLASLMESIRHFKPHAPASNATARLEAAFGDQAIAAALRPVLGLG